MVIKQTQMNEYFSYHSSIENLKKKRWNEVETTRSFIFQIFFFCISDHFIVQLFITRQKLFDKNVIIDITFVPWSFFLLFSIWVKIEKGILMDGTWNIRKSNKCERGEMAFVERFILFAIINMQLYIVDKNGLDFLLWCDNAFQCEWASPFNLLWTQKIW